jgi:hypothetical protein
LERLVGPARLAQQHGLPADHLCLGIAAALAYDAPTDPQAVAMQQAIANRGLEVVLTEDCGLLPHEALAREIKLQWRHLTGGAPRLAATPGNGSLAGFAALVGLAGLGLSEDVCQAIVTDLSTRYDAGLVAEVVALVIERVVPSHPSLALPLSQNGDAADRVREPR